MLYLVYYFYNITVGYMNSLQSLAKRHTLSETIPNNQEAPLRLTLIQECPARWGCNDFPSVTGMTVKKIINIGVCVLIFINS
jgi:hypothetical protein